MRNEGFTLIELLISLALLGIILTAVVYIYSGTLKSSTALQARNETLADSQVAQNYMLSKLKQASYVFPVGSNIQMSVAGGTSSKPGGSPNWLVGTDPIVAFILPPKTVTANGCSTATTSTVSMYCYAFYAYYAMNRGDYVNAATGANDPGSDALNDSTSWVLVEYRGYYTGTGFPTDTLSIPTGNQGRLLLDYVMPRTQTSDPLLFVINASLPQVPGTTSVTMNLSMLRNIAGQIVQLPSVSTDTPSGRFVQTVYPRNVGSAALAN